MFSWSCVTHLYSVYDYEEPWTTKSRQSIAGTGHVRHDTPLGASALNTNERRVLGGALTLKHLLLSLAEDPVQRSARQCVQQRSGSNEEDWKPAKMLHGLFMAEQMRSRTLAGLASVWDWQAYVAAAGTCCARAEWRAAESALART